jgi:hypothetical protein
MHKILISIISLTSLVLSSITLDVGTIDTENNTIEILINTTSPIRGFQFDIEGLELSGGHGGLAEDNGFNIYAAGDTALGFNVDGNEIPATVSSQLLTILDGTINGEICLPFIQNVGPEEDTPIFADSNGDALLEIEIGDGSCDALDIDVPEISFNLFEAYPNPFNPQLNIDISFLESGHIDVSVFNLNGQIVETIFSGSILANTLYTLNWDASNYSSGLYIVQVNGLNTKYSKIVNLLK